MVEDNFKMLNFVFQSFDGDNSHCGMKVNVRIKKTDILSAFGLFLLVCFDGHLRNDTAQPSSMNKMITFNKNSDFKGFWNETESADNG